MVAGDWLADLEPFSAAIVAAACARWRHEQTKRPTPADIIALCREYTPQRPAERRQITPEEYAEWHEHTEKISRRRREAFEWRQRFAESRGFPDFGAVIDYGMVKAFNLPCREGFADPPLETIT